MTAGFRSPRGAAVSAAGGSRHRDFGDAGGRQRSAGHFPLGPPPQALALALFGIERAPCHATYHCVFRSLDGDALARALGGFAGGRDEPGHIALDGKTLRSSRRLDAKALHVVSAFATQLSPVVGDLAVAPEENEITAALALLKELPLAGAIITGDAIFCQREVCQTITDGHGDYMFVVKDNQPALKADIAESFGDLSPLSLLKIISANSNDAGPTESAQQQSLPLAGSIDRAAHPCTKTNAFAFDCIPRLRENPKTPLAKRRDLDFTERMIRPGFLDIELRQNLIELARDGSAAHRLARRANALVLLDDGMSCEAIAKVLLLDDDTIRTWYRLYEEDGIEGLTNFSYEGSACQLSGEQQEKLKAWVATSLPRTTRQVGAWIENEFGVVYEGRSGLIALLHRLGLEYHKPNVIPRKLDEEKQKAFIEGYEKLLNSLGDDEAVLFADAVHPTHAARPVGCWAPSQEKLAIEQTSGRQRINIHGAIDLETGQTRMIEALTIDAASTIRLLQSIEALYPMLALIHVFLDNARYHHAKLVQEWLALPGRRIKLHFIPTYCPHLNPIERLWGLMHRNVTHNKCYATCAQFADATLSFLREKVPGNWADLCDSVTDNFRIINPKDFRVMT